jgi:hypothetical protein
MNTIEINSIADTLKSIEIRIDNGIPKVYPASFHARSDGNVGLVIKSEMPVTSAFLVDEVGKLTVNGTVFTTAEDAVVAINELANFKTGGGTPTNNPAEWGQIQGAISNQVDLQDELDGKVDKVSGKGLSTNDYTTTEKNKLAGIDTYVTEGLIISQGETAVGIRENLRDATSGLTAESYAYFINAASPTQAGVMTKNDKEALDALSNAAVTPMFASPNYAAKETTNRISASGGTWTADRIGYVTVSIQVQGNYSAWCEINGKRVGQNYSGTATSNRAMHMNTYAVKPGDVVKLAADGGTTEHVSCYFIPPSYSAAPTVARTPLLGAQYQAFQENSHGASATDFYPANGTIAAGASKDGGWVTVDRYCMMKIGRISTGPVQGFFKTIQLERDGSTHDLAANQNMSSDIGWSDVGGWTHVLRPGDKIRCRLINHGGASATYTKSLAWSYVGLCNIIWENIPT